MHRKLSETEDGEQKRQLVEAQLPDNVSQWSMKTTMKKASEWLLNHAEDHVGRAADFNQYWYSPSTISTILDVLREHCLHGGHSACLDIAFVSTPSLFFALTPSERACCRVLDFDAALGEDEPGFVLYDFNHPTDIPKALAGAFKCVVIDPPYITTEVWQQYITTAKYLLRDGGLVLLTTVLENADMLRQSLDVRPNTFLPSIPNLPYQYALFTNFAASALDVRNEEIDDAPEEFFSDKRPHDKSASRHEAEVPIRGAVTGAGVYDFEAMIEAELRRERT